MHLLHWETLKADLAGDLHSSQPVSSHFKVSETDVLLSMCLLLHLEALKADLAGDLHSSQPCSSRCNDFSFDMLLGMAFSCIKRSSYSTFGR